MINNNVKSGDNVSEIPGISVVIPCYNCSDTIRRAIESVLAQTFTKWHLLLVNNNSTDNTVSILESYRDKYPDKITVLYETKKGAPAARNKGLSEAVADWVQFLDADDELLPGKLESQYVIASAKNVSIVTGPFTLKGTRGGLPFEKVREIRKDDFWIALAISQLGITSANLWNREVLQRVNGWNEQLTSSQEYDLMFRMFQVLPSASFDNSNQTNIYIGSGESVSRVSGKEKGKALLQSRIGLRIRIKQYLAANNLLTPGRRKHLDVFIYQQLVENYRFIPEYISEQLKISELKIPFGVWLKGKYFMMKMDLKGVLKRGGSH